ncbi:MAG: hypothetical protein KDA96_26330 [Planctomycetaceae bacterium]|nr:hypothetical protein [Planctomycetaceae bacterium]
MLPNDPTIQAQDSAGDGRPARRIVRDQESETCEQLPPPHQNSQYLQSESGDLWPESTHWLDRRELTDIAPMPGPGQFPGLRHPIRSTLWLVYSVVGLAGVILVLSLLAAVPGLNLLAMGYIVDAQKRVARTGKLRDGFPLREIAPRLGTIILGSLIVLLPVRLLAALAGNAMIVRAGTDVSSTGLVTGLRLLQFLTAVHLLLAIGRGGSLSCFLRPLKNLRWMIRRVTSGRYPIILQNRLDQVIAILQPRYHFLLGLKSIAGAVAWLIIPTALLVAYSAPNRTNPLFGVLSFVGVITMIPVGAWLPMLQVHQGVSGRFVSIFDYRTARRIIRNAPISWAVSTLVLYALTIPLYLPKVFEIPADAFFLITPFFILLMYPARILIAWSYHKGMRSEEPRWFGLRWGFRLLMLPLLLIYAAFLFATPAISELGKSAPLQNHAYLSPVPYGELLLGR